MLKHGLIVSKADLKWDVQMLIFCSIKKPKSIEAVYRLSTTKFLKIRNCIFKCWY